MNIPRLTKGKGFKGPEFYGCFNTGMAPCIFHSRSGKFIVGPELRCRDAMRQGIGLTNARSVGEGNQTVWLYKTRKPAAAKFKALCAAQSHTNDLVGVAHAETLAKAKAGDLAAMLQLGDF